MKEFQSVPGPILKCNIFQYERNVNFKLEGFVIKALKEKGRFFF